MPGRWLMAPHASRVSLGTQGSSAHPGPELPTPFVIAAAATDMLLTEYAVMHILRL